MEKKISENSIRPFEPDTHDQYPEILKDVTSKSIEEVVDDIIEVEDYIYTMENNESKYVHTNKHVRNLKENEKVLLVINENHEGIFIPAKSSITYKKDNSTLDTISHKKYSELINKTILIDRNGFYNTYKEFFTKFMLLNGENLKFEINNNIINGYHNLIKLANLWLDGFKILIINETQSNPEMKMNKIKERVANLLINSGVNYDLNYIKNYWLEDPIELETNFGTLNLYSIEHPRNINTLTEVYKNLNEKYDDFNLTEKDAYNSFNAARTIQKIRSSFLKHKNVPNEYKGLDARFKLEIQNIIKNSESFKVASFKEVTIEKEIKPYVKIKDYTQYIK